ncbi:Mitosis inhibitor protein kinase wee1 [Balamuthia mandrillaris]
MSDSRKRKFATVAAKGENEAAVTQKEHTYPSKRRDTSAFSWEEEKEKSWADCDSSETTDKSTSAAISTEDFSTPPNSPPSSPSRTSSRQVPLGWCPPSPSPIRSPWRRRIAVPPRTSYLFRKHFGNDSDDLHPQKAASPKPQALLGANKHDPLITKSLLLGASSGGEEEEEDEFELTLGGMSDVKDGSPKPATSMPVLKVTPPTPAAESPFKAHNTSETFTPPSTPPRARPTPDLQAILSPRVFPTTAPASSSSSSFHAVTPLRIRPPPCNINPFSPERPSLSNKRQTKTPTVPYEPMVSTTASTYSATTITYSRYLEEFEEIAEIGSGTFSNVYKCRNRVDGWLYAVKRARAQFKSSGHRENTLKEVYANASLGCCPNIVRYHSAWVENDRLYIQTEFCDGGSLDDQLNGDHPPLSEQQLCDILRQVANGLAVIHSRKLAHLDVKPENIFKDLGSLNPAAEKGKVIYKIGDLGLVSLAEAHSEVHEGDSRYLSRELLQCNVDCSQLSKADIFSLGCSVYELALGKALPSRGDEWNAIRDGHIALPRQSFSVEFEELIKLMLHPDVQRRPSAEELLHHPLLLTEEERRFQRQADELSSLQSRLQAALEQNALLQKELRRVCPSSTSSLLSGSSKHVASIESDGGSTANAASSTLLEKLYSKVCSKVESIL